MVCFKPWRASAPNHGLIAHVKLALAHALLFHTPLPFIGARGDALDAWTADVSASWAWAFAMTSAFPSSFVPRLWRLAQFVFFAEKGKRTKMAGLPFGSVVPAAIPG